MDSVIPERGAVFEIWVVLFLIGYNSVNNRVLIECALDHLNYSNLTDIIKNL